MNPDALLPLYREHLRAVSAAYSRALETAGFDAILVHSGSAKKRTAYDDQFFPLRPTPEFQRWAPLVEADCAVFFELGKRATVFWPPCTSFWERPPAPASLHFQNELDVRREAPPADVARAGKRVAWYGEDLVRAAELGFTTENINPPQLLAALDNARVLKTPYELFCLAEANRIAGLGHEAVRRAFAGGAHSELELHLEFLKATKQDDQDTPYKNIVALGANGAVLHHVSYGRDASNAASLLVDAGASYLGYGSDITRTWVRRPADNASSAAGVFAALTIAMEAMQLRLVSAVKVGLPYEALHDESHKQLCALLVEAGLAKGSLEELNATGVSRAFYPHGLGHSLGLVTHDVGCASTRPRADNPFLRNTESIAEGQVFTIEPGLYFIGGLLAELRAKPAGELVNWNVVEALAPFGGIRIEDDLEVQATGVRNYTREVLPIGGGTV